MLEEGAQGQVALHRLVARVHQEDAQGEGLALGQVGARRAAPRRAAVPPAPSRSRSPAGPRGRARGPRRPRPPRHAEEVDELGSPGLSRDPGEALHSRRGRSRGCSCPRWSGRGTPPRAARHGELAPARRRSPRKPRSSGARRRSWFGRPGSQESNGTSKGGRGAGPPLVSGSCRPEGPRSPAPARPPPAAGPGRGHEGDLQHLVDVLRPAPRSGPRGRSSARRPGPSRSRGAG